MNLKELTAIEMEIPLGNKTRSPADIYYYRLATLQITKKDTKQYNLDNIFTVEEKQFIKEFKYVMNDVSYEEQTKNAKDKITITRIVFMNGEEINIEGKLINID